MIKHFAIGALIVTTSALALPAYACDFHGAGYGSFGIRGADWQPYNPKVYKTDPALLEKKADETAQMTPLPTEKTRPSFSNAANRAALVAKARLMKKAKTKQDKSATKDKVDKKPL